MRFITYSTSREIDTPRPGILGDGQVIDLTRAWEMANQKEGRLGESPTNLLQLIEKSGGDITRIQLVLGLISNSVYRASLGVTIPLSDVQILTPIQKPPSVRDFYAFEKHVKTAFGIRGTEVPEEWYQIPVFYFSNPGAIYGPDEHISAPKATKELDFELEIACIIGKHGRDIQPEECEEYIFGLTIMNDWSARDLQRLETRVRLGPAKGKDFATSLGPTLVTLDELKNHSAGRPGIFNLEMTARVNGKQVSHGNLRDIHYSFGEIIARASADSTLYPGDVIGTGTVGSGSLLEATLGKGPWLKPGDEVELEVECLGTLRNWVQG